MYYIPKLLKKISISSKKNCVLDKTSKICGGCSLVNTSIGKYSYVGYDTEIVNVNIGNYCSVAGKCMIGGGEHPLDYVSTSPIFYKGKNILGVNFANNSFLPYKKTIIENDVWIAHDVKIKGGVTISTGAVIGMGAVVTHDIGPYEIWAGNPARLIKKRFNDEIIERLLISKWWDLNSVELQKYAQWFYEPELFLKNINIM